LSLVHGRHGKALQTVFISHLTSFFTLKLLELCSMMFCMTYNAVRPRSSTVQQETNV